MSELRIYEYQNNPAGEVITMGNTHLRQPTRENLREYANDNGHKSLDDAVVALLAEHRELLPTRRENVLLTQLVRILDTGDKS